MISKNKFDYFNKLHLGRASGNSFRLKVEIIELSSQIINLHKKANIKICDCLK